MSRIWKVTLISIIGFATFLGAVLQSPIDSFSQPVYQLKVTPSSILFLSSDLSEELLRISPLDDYIYEGSKRSLVATAETFGGATTITTPIQQFIDLFLLNQDRFKWGAYTKSGLDIEYEVINQSGREIFIKRKLKSISGKVDYIGSSYLICSTCLVTDQKKRYFINQEYIELGRIASSQSIGLTPTILAESLLPRDTTTITILDSSYNPKMSIMLEPNTDAYYHQKWNIVELKNSGNLSKQRISLY